jgi:hypothetical protein
MDTHQKGRSSGKVVDQSTDAISAAQEEEEVVVYSGRIRRV